MKSSQTSDLVQMLKETERRWGHHSKETARVLVELGKAYSDLDDVMNAESSFARAAKIFEAAGDEVLLKEARRLLDEVRNRITGDLTFDEDSLTMSFNNVPVFQDGEQIGEPDLVEEAKSLLSEFSTATGNNHQDTDEVEHEGTAPEDDEQPATTGEPEDDYSDEPLRKPQTLDDLEVPAKTELAPAEPGPIDRAIERAKFEISQMRKKGSENTSQLADLLVEVASLYSKKNQPERMEDLLVEALSIRESIYGKNHLSVSKDLKNLGRMYLATRDYDQAEPPIKRALEIREAILGPFHPQVADIAELYVKVLHQTERDEEASSYEERIKESQARHPSDWEDYRKAAGKAMDEKSYFLAQALWLAARDETESFEEDDPRIMTTLEGLAHVYWKRSRYDKAEPLCREILQISERLLGKDHLDVAFAVKNLALVNERLGKFSDASVLYQEALRVMEQCLGIDHPDVEDLRKSKKEALDKAHEELAQKIQKSF